MNNEKPTITDNTAKAAVAAELKDWSGRSDVKMAGELNAIDIGKDLIIEGRNLGEIARTASGSLASTIMVFHGFDADDDVLNYILPNHLPVKVVQ